MKNRESLYPGRVKLTPVDAANGIYDLTRADEPRDEGTPLNKKLLDYAVAACGVTAGTATAYTLDDEFGGFELVDGAKVNFRPHVASGVNPTLNVNGTGAKALVDTYGKPIYSGIPAGSWIHATYSSTSDCYVSSVVPRYDPAFPPVDLIANVTPPDASEIEITLPDEYDRFSIEVNDRFSSGISSYFSVILKTDKATANMFTSICKMSNEQVTASNTDEPSNSNLSSVGILSTYLGIDQYDTNYPVSARADLCFFGDNLCYTCAELFYKIYGDASLGQKKMLTTIYSSPGVIEKKLRFIFVRGSVGSNMAERMNIIVKGYRK